MPRGPGWLQYEECPEAYTGSFGFLPVGFVVPLQLSMKDPEIVRSLLVGKGNDTVTALSSSEDGNVADSGGTAGTGI